MKIKWYWYPLRRLLPVTYHLDKAIRVYWSSVFGVQITVGRRAWFVGLVGSRDHD